jgi:hypothetical protein
MLSPGIAIGGLLLVAALGLAGVIAFGGPTAPPPLVSMRDAVLKRDRTDLPKPTYFTARDQTTLAYRVYPAAARAAMGAAVLIHGSAGSGADMHEIAHIATFFIRRRNSPGPPLTSVVMVISQFVSRAAAGAPIRPLPPHL